MKLYNFAKLIAASNPKLKNEIVQAIEKFIQMHLVDLK